MSTRPGINASVTASIKKRFNDIYKGTPLIAGAVMAVLLLGVFGPGDLWAKGGTAKPVKGAPAPFNTPTLPDPVFTDPLAIHGFDITGFIQDMTVDASNTNCPNTSTPNRMGGTVVVNGTTITVPCNSVIQMPANTLTWAEFVHGGPLGLKQLPATYPSFEVHVVGNTVSGKQIAGLICLATVGPCWQWLHQSNRRDHRQY